MSSLMIMFSLLRAGRGSLGSSRALKTSARIRALTSPSTPRFCNDSFTTGMTEVRNESRSLKSGDSELINVFLSNSVVQVLHLTNNIH